MFKSELTLTNHHSFSDLPSQEANQEAQREKMPTASLPFKLTVVTWSLLENVLFSGLRAGWPALVFILKAEGVYQELCTGQTAVPAPSVRVSAAPTGVRGLLPGSLNVTSASSLMGDDASREGLTSRAASDNASSSSLDCAEQDRTFNQCFTIATALMAVSALLYGQLNFRFGIRVPRLLSVVLFIGGCLSLAFVSVEQPWLIYPGLILVSAGGNALYITNSQVSYYFKTGAVAVVGLECGALEASSFIMNVVKIAYENGIKPQYAYSVLGSLYLLTLVSTFLFFPKRFVTSSPGDESKETLDDGDGHTSATYTLANKSNPLALEGSADKGHQQTCRFADLEIGSQQKDRESVSKIAVFTLDNGIDSNPIFTKNGNSFMRERAIGLAPNNTAFNNSTQFSANTEAYKEASSIQLQPSDLKIESTALKSDKKEPLYIPSNKETDMCKKYGTSLDKPETFLGEKNGEGFSYNGDVSNGTGINSQLGEFPKDQTLEIAFIAPPSSFDAQQATGADDVVGTSITQSLLSRTFLLYLFWAAVVQLVLAMALGTFNPWLDFVLDGDQQSISLSTDILLYSMLGSPVLSLSLGLAMDALQYWRKDIRPFSARTTFSAAVCLGATSVLSILVCVLFMLKDRHTIVVTSIALVVFRTSLYSCGTGFLRLMYPTHHFGILCGVMSLTAGAFSFLQYPLFIWVQTGGNIWTEVFGFLAGVGAISLSQPVYLFWRALKM